MWLEPNMDEGIPNNMTTTTRERMQIWKKETLDEIRSCATEEEADEIVLKFIETIKKEAKES